MPQEETHHIWLSIIQMENLGNYGNVNAKDKTGRAWNLQWDKPWTPGRGPVNYPGPNPPGPTPDGSPVPISVRNWNDLVGYTCKGCPPTGSKTIAYVPNPPDLPIVFYIWTNPDNAMESIENAD